jgi:hypothetical protein
MRTHGKRDIHMPTIFQAVSLSPIPRNYSVSLTDLNLCAAMEAEYSALLANVVAGKCVFKHKFKADGSLERYMATWVLRGFTQRPVIDFTETFSPVAKVETIQTVLSLALSRSWPIHQLDVNNTFL